ncbi:SGNH/GDSL hydrolase family protein [Phreatobacter sp.]|uniref:SGNH/GDSL hydrolase family protein n=1 Tax=Phreatobacter sp. TaxID=1966341 RepID=UPI003F710E60
MIRCLTALFLAAALSLGPAAQAFAPGARPAPEALARCDAGAEVRRIHQDLPRSRAAVAEGRVLTIVTLGSTSTLGAGASSEAASYPGVLETELSRLLPGHVLRVVNAGVASNSAHQMYMRLDDDVLSEEPRLVIWQTGVNDAIHDVGIERFKRILRKGIARLREAGVDVVLMDMQPLRQMERYPVYADYQAALHAVALETGTPVFRRFALLGVLLADGRLRQDEIVGTGEAGHAVDSGYFCLGMNLARSLAEILSPRAVQMR